MIEQVTFTGADDSVSPEALSEISKEFPFVEWGILLGTTYSIYDDVGVPRFPSTSWVDSLAEVYKKHMRDELAPMKLSAHWCEPFVGELITKGRSFNDIQGLNGIPNIFKRTQINTHGLKYTFAKSFLEEIRKHPEMEFILQIDGVNDDFVLGTNLPNISLLQDYSSGAGTFANEWGQWEGKKYGYAGGLNIDTLPAAMDKWLGRPANETIAWIAMESGVRTGPSVADGNKSVFDFQKEEDVLTWADPHWYYSTTVLKSSADAGIGVPHRKTRMQHAST